MAAAMRTEHVQQTPRGWRVRTIVPGPQSQHEVRIAFPPGRRKKGSGRVVEILHPESERNPKCDISKKARTNPGELLIFGNPSGKGFGNHRPGCGCKFCDRARKLQSGELKPPKLPNRKRRNAASSRVAATREVFKRGREEMAQRYAAEISELRQAIRDEDDPTKKTKLRSLLAKFGAKRFYSNPSKLEALRAARHRAEQIRSARLNPVFGFSHGLLSGKRFESPSLTETRKLARKVSREAQQPIHIEKDGKLFETIRDRRSRLNPKRATQRRRRADRNPSETKQAVRLFQGFHGHDPKEIAEKHVSAAVRLDYTALGDLKYLVVETPLGKEATFTFDGDGVKLASSPDGKQLYCIGGNQNILPLLEERSTEKDFIDLGDGLEVAYLARKVHGEFRPIEYFHEFGELNGAHPRVMFDKMRKQIFFIGGDYFIDVNVRAPGTPLGKVSPGLEN